MKKHLFRGAAKKAVTVSAVTALAMFALDGPAKAASTFDPTCPYTPNNATGKCGFVGKGDVQTALGWNNDKLQKNAGSLTFTYVQPALQALSQSGTQTGSQQGSQVASQSSTQAGTQTAVQEAGQTVTCNVWEGGAKNPTQETRYGSRPGTSTGTRDGSRTGTRDGSRTGTRSGDRVGTRAGTLAGSVSYSIAYDSRVKNQITGFLLNGATSPGFAATAGATPSWGDFTPSGDYSFGDYAFGEYSWGEYTWGEYAWGEYSWGDIQWRGWGADGSTGQASVCLNQQKIDSGDVTDVVLSDPVLGDITERAVHDGAVSESAAEDGAITDGAITDGDISYGDISYGAVSPNGAATLYVNGKAIG